MTCKSGALTQDGSRSSSTRIANLSTGLTIRCLTSETVRMLKDKLSGSRTILAERIRNGRLFILINLKLLPQKDSAKTLVSILIDHSTLCLNFH